MLPQLTHEQLYAAIKDMGMVNVLKELDENVRKIETEKNDGSTHPELIKVMQPYQDVYHLSVKRTVEHFLDHFITLPLAHGRLYSEKFLVAFGNFLLSPERRQYYKHRRPDHVEELLKEVNDADLENFINNWDLQQQADKIRAKYDMPPNPDN